MTKKQIDLEMEITPGLYWDLHGFYRVYETGGKLMAELDIGGRDASLDSCPTGNLIRV